jgi:murein DD-endopeptidase MepM/ murein hydrolase activator NlpD
MLRIRPVVPVRSVLGFVCIALTGGAAQAETPRLEFPVNCVIGESCFIRNYFDLDPGVGRLDHGCGRLSYDGHDGTDIRTLDIPAMRLGVTVRAAADGVVKATRDGMADASIRKTGAAAVAGREAGNGVVIDHGEGWETQYSHLALGSVLVAPGEQVEAGTPLGQIGLSGQTEFPHVEFSVRKDGVPLDPFTGAAEGWSCGDPATALWSEAALRDLVYIPTGPLIAGFAATAPDPEAIRSGNGRLGNAAFDPEALVFWADVFGAQAGDTQTITIVGPDGAEWFRRVEVLSANNVSWFAFGGRRKPAEGWAPGRYTGRYLLERNGEALVDRAGTIDIGG